MFVNVTHAMSLLFVLLRGTAPTPQFTTTTRQSPTISVSPTLPKRCVTTVVGVGESPLDGSPSARIPIAPTSPANSAMPASPTTILRRAASRRGGSVGGGVPGDASGSSGSSGGGFRSSRYGGRFIGSAAGEVHFGVARADGVAE